MTGRVSSVTIVVAILGTLGCADDIAAPRPRGILQTEILGTRSLPGTANATLEWLGEPPGFGAIPLGISASGVTVGLTFGVVFPSLGVLWDPPRLVYSNTPTLQYGAVALNKINSVGVAAGWGSCASCSPAVPGTGEAVRFNTTAPILAAWEQLANPPGLTSYIASDINNFGDAVGITRDLTQFPSTSVWSALWPAAGGAIDLGAGTAQVGQGATAIAPNLTGPQILVVGWDRMTGPAPFAGWKWQGGVKTYLTGIVFPQDVADNGWIIGADDANCIPFAPSHCAVLLRGAMRVMLHAQCFADLPAGIQDNSHANAITLIASRTVIVGDCGSDPYVWYDDGLGNFSGEYLPLYPGDDFGVANDINSAGHVVGYTTVFGSNVHHSLRWTFTLPVMNRAPIALPDNAQVTSPNAVTLAVLANDSDPDGDALSISSVTQPDKGIAVITSGGQSITYTPTASFVGQAQFTYTVTDGRGGTASALITVRVNAPGPSADLVLTLTNGVELGRVRLVVTEQNLGPNQSAGATLSLLAAAGTRVLQGGACTTNANSAALILTCRRGAQSASGRRTMTLILLPPSSGSFTLNGTLVGLTSDPNTANNLASTTAIKP